MMIYKDTSLNMYGSKSNTYVFLNMDEVLEQHSVNMKLCLFCKAMRSIKKTVSIFEDWKKAFTKVI